MNSATQAYVSEKGVQSSLTSCISGSLVSCQFLRQLLSMQILVWHLNQLGLSPEALVSLRVEKGSRIDSSDNLHLKF